jgi:hypothetical protein
MAPHWGVVACLENHVLVIAWQLFQLVKNKEDRKQS